MGIVDKAKNAAEDAIGKAKEVVGEVTGNDELKGRVTPRSARHQGQPRQRL